MNKSGIYPHDDRVLILPDEVITKVGEQRIEKIQLPDNLLELQSDAGLVGTLVAKGKTAFRETHMRLNADTEIALGTKVMYARYVGLKVKGMDGKEYRLIYDRDIIAMVDPKLEMELA